MTTSMTGSRGAAGNIIPKGYKAGQLQQFTPEQLELFKRSFSTVGPESQLAKMAAGEEEGFAPYENVAKRQFQEQIGGLASRFSGMGLGARRGSGFQNLATQGAQDFASQLAARRQDLQRQAIKDMFGISESLLSQKPYEQFLIEKQQKKQGYGGLIGAGIGGIGGFFAGGPPGALAGATLGYNVGSSF